jgi:hypothetical protein
MHQISIKFEVLQVTNIFCNLFDGDPLCFYKIFVRIKILNENPQFSKRILDCV